MLYEAIFHRSFPSAPAEHTTPDCISLKPRLSSAHFSTVPHVQVLIKLVEEFREYEGCWVKGEEEEVRV